MTHRIVWLGLAVLSLVAAFPGFGVSSLRSAVMVLVLGLLPGWWMARRLAAHAAEVERLQIGIVLSPLLVGLPVAALHVYAGWSLAAAGRTVVLLFATLAAWEAFRTPQPRDASAPAVAWWPAALWAAITLAFLVMNPVLPPRSDGWFHSAVTLQIAGMGLPPEDPYFAGLPLLYFWGYHAWAATWLTLQATGSVWTPLIAFNVAAAVAVVLGVCAIAARLGASRRGQWWAAGVAIVGYAPLAWLLLVARSMIGEVTGIEELQRIAAGGGASLRDHIKGGMLDSSMVFFGDKYLVLTPFALGLALTCTFLISLWDLVRKPAWRSAVLIALLQASALFLHTFVAFVTGILGAVVWGVVLLQRLTGSRHDTVRVLSLLAAAFLAATILMFPYVTTILSGKRQILPWGMSWAAVVTLLHGGLLIVPAGIWWLWRARGQRSGSAGLILVSIVITVMGFVVGLPGANQAKFYNLLFLVLAAPAGLLLAQWDGRLGGWPRVGFRGALAFAVVPTFLVSIWGYVIEDGQGTWHEPTPGEREALQWVVDETPPEAMFVDRSGASDLIGLTGRSVIWGNEWGERNWGADPVAQEDRRRAARELAAGTGASPRTGKLIRELGRPVFIMARRSASEDPNSAWNRLSGRAHYESAFNNRDVVLYRYVPIPLLETRP